MHLPLTSVGPEHELTLLLSGTRACRESRRRRILDLADRVDYRALDAHLRDQGTMGLIGQRLCEVAPSAPSDAFRQGAERFAAASRRQGLSQQMLTVRLAAALEEAGIPSLPLKGPFFAERVFGDVGARASADIDLLVSESQLPRAVEIVSSFGYRPHPFSAARGGSAPVLHECVVHQADLPQVEIHWASTGIRLDSPQTYCSVPSSEPRATAVRHRLTNLPPCFSSTCETDSPGCDWPPTWGLVGSVRRPAAPGRVGEPHG